MFTKENTLTLPLIIILYEACFFNSRKYPAYKNGMFFLVLLPIIPVILFFANSPTFTDIQKLFHQPITMKYYFLTQLRVMLTYIKLLVFPFNQNLDYDYQISKTLLDPYVITSFLGLSIIILVSVRLLSRYRLIAFSVFWFFITLLPESSIIPLNDVISEHRLYLPMVGYSLFIVSGAYYLFRGKFFKGTILLLSFLIFGYSIATYQRNRVWENELTLWSSVIKLSPNKAGPYVNLGIAFANRQEYDKAIADLNQAIRLNSNYAEAYNARGFVFIKKQEYDKAIADLNQAIRLVSNYVEAYNNRGIAFANRQEYDKAIADLNRVLKIDTNYIFAYTNLAKIYATIGNNTEAIALNKRLLAIDPYCSEAYNHMGVIYRALGRYKEAEANLKEAIRIKPDFREAYSNLCATYGNEENFQQAIMSCYKALEGNPDNALAHFYLAVTYFHEKKYDLAIKHCDRAAALGYEVDQSFLDQLKPYRK
ncbi:MAG: tetratricopeptide repeat protein [Candidatus Omnitrophica bacterium]|nr:tetratricopeptide repeat protein [Candidatus Omnitrophota bacterium]